jgi:hypothetical protein
MSTKLYTSKMGRQSNEKNIQEQNLSAAFYTFFTSEMKVIFNTKLMLLIFIIFQCYIPHVCHEADKD